jgi:hypothetical protein
MKTKALFSSAATMSGRVMVLGVLAVSLLGVPCAQAAFHLWAIREVYTDSSGNLQFIELFDSSGSQNFVNGMQIQVSNVGNTQTHTFIIPGSPLSGNTLNHALLFGTSGLQAAGGPAPDYTIPNNFLFAAGGSISFFGANSGAYTALPTDGSLSRTWGGGNAVNSPQNYSDQSGVVVVPEPTSLSLIGLTGWSLWCGFRSSRRRQK